MNVQVVARELSGAFVCLNGNFLKKQGTRDSEPAPERRRALAPRFLTYFLWNNVEDNVWLGQGWCDDS